MPPIRSTNITEPLSNACISHKHRSCRIGLAADAHGFELKCQLAIALRVAGHEVIDFGTFGGNNNDDYADFIVPLAESVATGDITKGLAICGSGVGASIVSNKVPGARAAFVTDSFSAHQGVEEDGMNIMCLGSSVTGQSLAWELVQIFIRANYKDSASSNDRISDLRSLEREPHSLQKYAR